jgi:hypothetical protein
VCPLRGKKKKAKKEEEEEEQLEEEKIELPPPPLPTPVEWLSGLTNSSEVQSDLPLLPDVDMQFQVGSHLVRFMKKGLEKPMISEERSLRPDAIIMVSEKAWRQLLKAHDLDDFLNQYRKYSRNPAPEEYIKVQINKEKLLSDRGILRSRLFKGLLAS